MTRVTRSVSVPSPSASAPRDATSRATDVTVPATGDGLPGLALSLAIRLVPVNVISASPHQAPARTSRRVVGRIEKAIEMVGSLEALEEREDVLATLGDEARQLTELAMSMKRCGLGEPLIVHRAPDGYALVSGHRRLVAARLAGISEVRVADLGELGDADAATRTYHANLHRRQLTPFQDAFMLAKLQDLTAVAGRRLRIRAFAHLVDRGKSQVGALLAIARAFPPKVVTAVGGGDEEGGAEALSTLSFRDLRTLGQIPGVQDRVRAAQSAIAPSTPRATVARGAALPPFAFSRRANGWKLSLSRPVASLTKTEKAEAITILEMLLAELWA